MGEFLLTRRSGSIGKPPVLNENYPMDITVIQSDTAVASFQVFIDEDGMPDEYTYQWYLDGVPVGGVNSHSYVATSLSTVATHTVYCEVENKAGIIRSRVATLEVVSFVPVFEYSGNSTAMRVDYDNRNWEFDLLESGSLKLLSPFNEILVDIFLVGGGCGGDGTHGGCGGETLTVPGVLLLKDDEYIVCIGDGGSGGDPTSVSGGDTVAFGHTAKGGTITKGGSGGGGWGYTHCGDGGSDGDDGESGIDARDDYSAHEPGGKGQGRPTRAFGEPEGRLCSGGGGAFSAVSGAEQGSGGAGGGGDAREPGIDNLGGGGGGLADGGCGLIIIRNHREVAA